MLRLSLMFFCSVFGLVLFGQTSDEQGDPITSHHSFSAASSGFAEATTIPIGDSVEGDFHIAPAFEPLGGECWIAHRATSNISIIDVESGLLKTVLPTGDFPIDIAFTDSLALVACGSNQIDLFDWRLDRFIRTIDLPGQPGRIEISANQKWAAVGLEDTDECVLIDLSDLTLSTISGFPVGISGFSFITSNTRNLIRYNGFDISPDGSQLVNGFQGPLRFYDLASGTMDSIPEIRNASEVKYTSDGSKLIAVVFSSNQAEIYQVDPQDREILNVIYPDVAVNSFYGHLAMGADGDRVFLPSSNSGVLIRFDRGDFIPITTSSAVFWTDIRNDGQVAIAGGFNTHLVDMESGAILGTTSGISLLIGSVSASGDYILAFDPLRRERVELYHTARNGIFPIDPVHPGSELEGDAPYSVVFTHDDRYAVVVNSLSGTVSVVDVATKSLKGIVALDNYEVYHIAITADNKYAYIGERLADQVSRIDLETMEVTHSIFSGGDRPDQTYVHPSGDKVYALNAGGTDAIGVIDISSDDPKFTRSFASGNTGISWTNRGIRCNLAMTPNGNYGVLATPFDDQIQIIDLFNDEILESIPADGFALQTALSEPINGRIYSATTLKNNSEVFIMESVGPDVVPFGGLSVGSNPTRIAYDPSTARFAVCSQDDRRIDIIDPAEFEIADIQIFPSHLIPIAVEFNATGDQFTLLQSSDPLLSNEFWVNDQSVDLGIAPSHYFDIDSDGGMAAVVSIHEDVLYLIDTELTEVSSHKVDLNAWYTVGPNPSEGLLKVRKNDKTIEGLVRLELFDLTGRQLLTRSLTSHETTIDLNAYAGILTYRIIENDVIRQSGRLVVK